MCVCVCAYYNNNNKPRRRTNALLFRHHGHIIFITPYTYTQCSTHMDEHITTWSSSSLFGLRFSPAPIGFHWSMTWDLQNGFRSSVTMGWWWKKVNPLFSSDHYYITTTVLWLWMDWQKKLRDTSFYRAILALAFICHYYYYFLTICGPCFVLLIFR